MCKFEVFFSLRYGDPSTQNINLKLSLLTRVSNAVRGCIDGVYRELRHESGMNYYFEVPVL